MGLDFGVYAKKQGEKPIELAYGRKSWELVYALVPDYDEYGYNSEGRWVDPPVTLERWDSLMKRLEKIGPKLEDIQEAYVDLYNWPDYHTPKLDERYNELVELCFDYEMWYNKNFDAEPHLGYDFSVSYMLDFWNARDEVRKYLEDPEYEVRAYISY